MTFAYRDGKQVLKKLNLKIKSGEKIGIVGRTGAGKSSLISALFRLRNPHEGDIIVNGKNAVSESSLLNLRKGLSIIPQEPFIFADTIRKNIDPLEESADKDIWEVVENCGLDEKIRNLSEGLSYELAEKGANLSVGEKQLICLARATLKKSKILLIGKKFRI